MLRRLALLTALSAAAACGDDTGLPDARMNDGRLAGGTISLSWSLADGGRALTCDQAGAGVTVTVTMLPKDGAGAGITDAFTCSGGKGTTKRVTPGVYDLQITLSSASGDLSTAPPITGVTVVEGQDRSVGEVKFAVNASGGLKLKVGAAGKTSNCGAIGAGGAAIETTRLELQTVDDMCVATTFAIAAGAGQPAGSFASMCPPSTSVACIEQDQEVTVASLPSGRYRLVATGLNGATACWGVSSIIRVPAAGAVGNLGTLSLVATNAAGCPKPLRAPSLPWLR